MSREEEQTGGSLEETRFGAKTYSGGDALACRSHCGCAKDYAIQDTKQEIQALTATVDDAGAKIASLKAQVEDITTKIAETKGELASAIRLREKEHQNFMATED